jgi:hypothetical protein
LVPAMTETRRKFLATIAASAVWLATSGCMNQQNARYIYQDGQYGVIGIPANTPFGQKNYLKQSQELMARHFPDGYEIVRTEEVVEGQRILNQDRKTEYETDPTIAALNQTIKVGKLAETRSLETKDSLPILESRIIYKRRSPHGPFGANGFSALASLTPEFYLDPNEMARCRARVEIAEAKKGNHPTTTITTTTTTSTDKAGDSATHKVAHEAPK